VSALLDSVALVPQVIPAFFFVACGMVVGSFLNVVIARMPAGLSVVSPRSRCPSCETPIGALDNIPLLSWIVLRGRCRSCSWPIPIRYPLVEVVTGLIFLLVFLRVRHHLPLHPDLFFLAALHGAVFGSLLLAISVIDLDHMIIPDRLSLPGAIVGILIAFVAGPATGVRWREAALGAFGGALFLLVVAESYRLLRRREGMGMGDVKLMATLGAFVGLRALPFMVFAAAMQGILLAIVWLVLRRLRPSSMVAGEDGNGSGNGGSDRNGDGDVHEDMDVDVDVDLDAQEPAGLATTPVPFGPFLALGAFEWYLVGDLIGRWFPFLASP
jgi:leader peptidase (prepilin peptidase) / N-methyltransferase